MERKEKIKSSLLAAKPYWWLVLFVSTAWFFVAALTYAKNWYGFYNLNFLLSGVVIVPLLFFGLSLVLGSLILPRLTHETSKKLPILLCFALLIAALLTWLFPSPGPALNKFHTLRLISTGEKNPASRGEKVEVEWLRSINGSPIALDRFLLSGDWKLSGNRLISSGERPGSIAELSGMFPAGVDLRVRYQPKGGTLLVELDDMQQELDLYSAWDVGGNAVLKLPAWNAYSLLEKILTILAAVLYFLGLASLAFAIALLVELRSLPDWVERLLFVLIYLSLFVLFLGLKRSYANFNAERVYGDTITYVQTAQEPFTSISFWFSDRTFTLPVLYKITGMTSSNYTDIPAMRKTADYQTWFSAFSWVILGIAVVSSLRKKWLGPPVFAAILFFSLGLEISLWDRLLYSESLSFSLFAVLTAFWIGLGELTGKERTKVWMYLYLLAMILVTIFYSFTRDSNLYLAVSAALVFGLAVVLKRVPTHSRKYYLIYGVIVLGLFIYQNMTVSLGDRWQVHVYDNLVRRVISDEEALKYFQEAGLPTSQKLMDLGGMGVAEYQGLLMHSELPEYQAVREWVNQAGQSTYLRYMLSHPEASLLTPLRRFGMLINGSNLEYRYAIFPGQPIPEVIALNDQKIYFRSPISLILLLIPLAFGIGAYWLSKEKVHPAWLVLTVVIASIPLLAFIIWNGNPLEIERHAIQIGIQFRLAGWLALFLLADWLAFNRLHP